MKSISGSVALLVMFVAGGMAQPQIARTQNNSTAIFNNYSNIFPGMPNYGIAQGAIFELFGAGLATTTNAPQSFPLPTSLSGTSVSITINSVTTQAILYYVSPGQINAIIPSATPVGTGQITVTVNGKTSAPAPITVVQSAFGMLSLNAVGNGPAAVFDVNSNYLGWTNAANPGDFLTLWGTGLGPVTGDETMAQQPADLTNIPIEVDIGGRFATVQYHGRSQYPGLDQINVQVPNGVSGCHVSVVVRSGNMVSNFGTIPVAASGRSCAEPVAGLTAGQIQSLMSKPTITRGVLDFIAEGDTSADAAFAQFTNIQFAVRQPGTAVSFNDCTVLNFTNATFPTTGLPTPIVPNTIKATALDAGPSIELTTPSGSGFGNQTLAFQNGSYGIDGLTGMGSLKGTYTFTGAGGADVGAFTAQVTWPGGGGGFNFTTPGNAGSVTRANGLTVAWNQPSNTDPDEFVQVYGFAFVPNLPFGAEYVCNVPLSAQQFAIPPAVLLALPSQASLGAMPQAVLEVNLIITKPFSAPGIDVGVINFDNENAVEFSYR